MRLPDSFFYHTIFQNPFPLVQGIVFTHPGHHATKPIVDQTVLLGMGMLYVLYDRTVKQNVYQTLRV